MKWPHIIGGKVEGNTRAPELVDIRSREKVKGDIFTDNLSVLEGAEFNGKIEMETGGSKVYTHMPKCPPPRKLRAEEAPRS